MKYQVVVDGKRTKVEIPIREYSLEADNVAREQIIRHFLDEEGARDVVIKTTVAEVRKFCEECE